MKLQFTPDNLAPSGQRDLLMINQALVKDVYFSVVSSANNEQLHFSKIKFDSDLYITPHSTNLTLCTGNKQRSVLNTSAP